MAISLNRFSLIESLN